jgi:hypothetical protein
MDIVSIGWSRMPVEPEQIGIGKSYVTATGHVWRVLAHKGPMIRFQVVATGEVHESPAKVFARAVESEVSPRTR